MKKWLVTTFFFSTLYFSGVNGMSLSAGDFPASLKSELASEFKAPENKWWVRDISSSYTWLNSGRIVWLLDSESERTAVVYINDSGEAVVLNKKAGLVYIRSLLESHFSGALHDDRKLMIMMEALKSLAIDPRGYVGSQDFLKRQERFLNQWLMGNVKDPELFKRYCKDRSFFYSGADNSWDLSFYVFTPDGGVDQVQVTGSVKPFRIKKLSIEIVESPGSFYFPAEL